MNTILYTEYGAVGIGLITLVYTPNAWFHAYEVPLFVGLETRGWFRSTQLVEKSL
jgi:hypothetical protein